MQGRIGRSTQMVNAKTAGCTFKVPKWFKRQEAALNRQRQQLRAMRPPPFDPTPRLKKPE